MEIHGGSMDQPVEASLKATYRSLLARGLEAGEAANLTAFLHGLPSAGFHWTLAEIEAVVRRRLAHAAELRAAAPDRSSVRSSPASGRNRTTGPARRASRAASTHVIDPPKP